MRKTNNIFETINSYLRKRGHEIVMSLFLDGYNGNNIYVRVDYVPKLSVYKVVWFDLNFIDIKHLDNSINVQIMTKFMADKLMELMLKSNYESGFIKQENIIGDRVEILSYVKEDRYEFVFDRFLPLEWKFLIDPLVIIFAYLPKGMECMLNEMFGKFDKTEDRYNLAKPFKFDLMNGDLNTVFKKPVLEHAQVLVDNDMVSFLEKVNDKYVAIIEGKYPSSVIVNELSNGYIRLVSFSDEKKMFSNMAAVILTIREKKKVNSFYKVKLVNGSDESLLDKITNSAYFLCFGLIEDRLLILADNGAIYEEPIKVNGKVQFEVIEDDDELSLSKVLEGYKK